MRCMCPRGQKVMCAFLLVPRNVRRLQTKSKTQNSPIAHETEVPKPARRWKRAGVAEVDNVDVFILRSAPVVILGHASQTSVFGQVEREVESSDDQARRGSNGDGARGTADSSDGGDNSTINHSSID